MDYSNLSPEEQLLISRFRNFSYSQERTVTKTTVVAAQYMIREIYQYFFNPVKIPNSNSSFNLSDDELEIITKFRNLKAGSGSKLNDGEQKLITEFRKLKR